MKKSPKVCPHCQFKISEPLRLIPASQAKKGAFFKDIPNDKILYNFIEDYGGVLLSENERKQIAFKENDIPEYVINYIHDNHIVLSVGDEPISQLACPKCHHNISSIYNDHISEVYDVLLIGMPGSSKSSLIAAISKIIAEKPLTSKNEKIRNGCSTLSFEYEYYNENFPPSSTVHTGVQLNRQPLFYCNVNDTMLIFHDYPGESQKENCFCIPGIDNTNNTILVYMVDPDTEYSTEAKQLEFLTNKIIQLHSDNKHYYKEHILMVKSDMTDDEIVKKYMIKPYERSEFSQFTGLYAARNTILKMTGHNSKIYDILSNLSDSVSISYVAALGCKTKEITVKKTESKDTVKSVELSAEWNPMYIYDFILSLTER